jgi:serpin B
MQGHNSVMRKRFLLVASLLSAMTACDNGGDGSIPGPGGKIWPPPLPPPVDPPQPPEVVYGSVKERDRSGKADGAQFTAVVAAQKALAVKLFNALRVEHAERNVAVGSYSINQVLGMLYAGARGVTAQEMQTALGWTMPADALHATLNALDLEILSRRPEVDLSIANRTWAQRGLPLQTEYLDVLTRHYGAPVAVADFSGAADDARASINDWVKRATGDKIAELFPAGSIDGNTRLVLANAMYLYAPWKYKLDPRATRPFPFNLLDGTRVDVDMMHYNEFLPSSAGADWRAVELPYRGDELSMVVIVPANFRDFEARLTPELLDDITGKLKHGGIHLALPRVKFSFHTSLNATLTGMGMGSLFAGADFSGITGAPGLTVAAVEHEVFLKVDEEGTAAAAATGASLAASHGPSVTADRPFLFLIRDRLTGAILFMGRVLDPRG